MKRPTLRAAHAISGCVIAVFAVLHLTNHLMALSGIDAHLAFMEAARAYYRHPAAETVLLACVLFQCASGLWFLVRDWRSRRGVRAWLQAGSGAYLAFFLLVHVGAVMTGRHALGLDTNFHFAAAGMHVSPFRAFFVPYYWLATFALLIHLGCALSWRVPQRTLFVGAAIAGPAVLGIVVATLITASLAGHFYPVEVPAPYLQTYLDLGRSRITYRSDAIRVAAVVTPLTYAIPPFAVALVTVSAAIMFILGGAHIVLTFFSKALTPRDDALRRSLETVSPVISRETTMWKAWVGFNASHSLGLLWFGATYAYLALAHPALLFGHPFLQWLGLAALAAYCVLAKRYWFRAPLYGIATATATYAVGMYGHLLTFP
jgi:hypothetical protein